MGRFTEVIQSTNYGNTVAPTATLNQPADQLAKAKDTAAETGLPLETVQRNNIPSGWNVDFSQYAEKAPVLNQKLNSEYASLYADDHENLSAQEGFLNEISRVGSNFGKAARSAIPAFNEAVWGILEAGSGVVSRGVTGPLAESRIIPQDPMAVAEGFFGEQRQISKAVRQKWRPDYSQLGTIESGVYSGVESLFGQIPGITASVLMGNPAPMLVAAGGVEGGQSFGEARDKGLNFWQSLNYGAGQGAVEVLTEKIPAYQLFKDLGLKSSFGKTLVNQMLAEIPGEQVATFLQDLNQQVNLNPEKSIGDFLDPSARGSAALQTLIATMVATGGQVSVAKITEKSLDGLGKLQQKSKLKARSDATMEEHIADIVRGGQEEVYVDADAFTTYFQEHGINPELAAREILGDATTYQQAAAAGAALKIPMARYVTKIAPTKHNDFFAREARVAPDVMNAREADQFAADFEKSLTAEDQKEVDQIQDKVSEKLTKIGFSSGDAETYAMQMARYFNALGDREGSSPLELYERWLDDIAEAEVVPKGAMEQAATPEPADGFVRLWHGGGAGITAISGDIGPGNIFGGLFASKSIESAASHGTGSTYFMDVPEDRVLSQRDIDYEISYDDQMGALKQAMPWLDESDVDAAYVAVLEDKSHNLDPDELMRIFREDDAGGASWEAQRIRGLVAKNLGYQAVEMADEHGVSYLVLPGAEIKPVSPNILLQGEQQPRGFMQIKPGRKLLIGLTQARDLSTFLHESGHFYLEVMRDVVADMKSREELSDSQKGIIQDSETLLKWLGVDSFDKIERNQHEQFARGIEAYFMEGKAPSMALRQAFARFRAWLIGVYKTARGLNVQLNDDVRAVFDRMFATDAEIDQARNEEQLMPIFTSAESMGKTAREFELYLKDVHRANMDARERLEQKILGEWRRQREQWWKEEIATVREEAEKELRQAKEYQTLATMQGKNLPAGAEAVKLDPEAIKLLYEVGKRQKLRGLGVVKKGGLSPDAAANLLGHSSGAKLVDMLTSLKPLKQAVSERAEAIMKDRHGDLLTDSADMADAARELVLNEYQEDVLKAELKAINDLQRKAAPFLKEQTRQQREAKQSGLKMMRSMPSVEMLKTIAARQIAQTKYRDLKPSAYLAAMRKSGKEAMKYLGEQNYEAAAYFKQRQMLGIELYRESMKVKEGLDKGVRFARKFTDKKVRQRLGKTDYLDQIDQILERFDFTNMTLRAVDARKSVAQFIEDQKDQGLPINLPLEVINEAYRKPYKDMTAEELVGVLDGIRHLDQMSRNREKLLKLQSKMRFDDLANEITKTIRDNAKSTKKQRLEEGLPQDKAAQAIDGFFASHRKMSNILQVMDGSDGGILFDSVIRPINEAGDKEASMREQAAVKLSELFAPYTTLEKQAQAKITSTTLGHLELGVYKSEFIPEINDSLTHAGRLSVALNWGNAGNRQRLMDGREWNEQQVQAILRTLTKEDWNFVQGIWDYIDSFWPQISAMSKRVDGVEPEKVDPIPIETPFGTYRGGYYPAKYSRTKGGQPMYMDAKEQAEKAFAGATMRATTKHGFRKERAAKVTSPIRLDLGVIFEHINEVIHDISHFETIMDVNRVIRDKRVSTAMHDHYGPQIYNQLKSALNDIAAGEVGAQNVVEQALNHLRAGVSIAAMGWNVSTALIQPTGFAQSAVRIGHKWLARGVRRLISSPTEMNKIAEYVDSKSDFMRLRAKTQMREINEIRNTLKGGSSKLVDSYFWMISRMQRVVDLPTWLGAYEKYIDEGFDDAKAASLADQAVIDSQGSGMTKDLAQVQRGSPAFKLFTNFYSYFNTTYNMAALATKKTDFTRPKEIGIWLSDMLMLFTVPVVLGVLIKEAIGALRGDDDDEALAQKLLREQAMYLTGTMVGVRELGSAAFGYFGYEGPAGTRAFSQVGKLAKQIEQGEADEAFWKALNQTAGILLHYPAGQVQRTTAGFDAMIDGETVNPFALIFGPPKED